MEMLKIKIGNGLFLFAGSLVLWAACQSRKPPLDEVAYRKDIDAWHAHRMEDLKGPEGWLNLAGLFWLKDGYNTFGSAADNNIIFPVGKIAEHAGVFFVRAGVVELQMNPGIEVKSDGKPLTSLIVYSDSTVSPQLEYGSLRWFIIERNNLLGVRLRDMEREELLSFKGVERFDVDPTWRVEAKFETYDPPHQIDITNILGQSFTQPSPGAVVFEHLGKTYRLDAIDEGGEEYFMIIGDSTNGISTYPSGRYMYVAKPQPDGAVILDFNKLYNPPCAFTPYATCPLPPKQNVLDFAVNAGEKSYGNHTSRPHEPN